MLYREIIAVSSEIHTKHINTMYGQKAELLNVKPSGIYTNHFDLKGSKQGSCSWLLAACRQVTQTDYFSDSRERRAEGWRTGATYAPTHFEPEGGGSMFT
jgi:hypothetical protein